MDPSLRIDVLSELPPAQAGPGVLQVPGLHNGSKAALFQGTDGRARAGRKGRPGGPCPVNSAAARVPPGPTWVAGEALQLPGKAPVAGPGLDGSALIAGERVADGGGGAPRGARLGG